MKEKCGERRCNKIKEKKKWIRDKRIDSKLRNKKYKKKSTVKQQKRIE